MSDNPMSDSLIVSGSRSEPRFAPVVVLTETEVRAISLIRRARNMSPETRNQCLAIIDEVLARADETYPNNLSEWKPWNVLDGLRRDLALFDFPPKVWTIIERNLRRFES